MKTISRPVPERTSNELLAVGYVSDAQNYIGAATALTEFRFFGPRYFLFCHSMELLLKAQILCSGGHQKDLRGIGIRHDLEKLYDRAVELGYKPSHESVKQIAIWLAPYHSDHTFRYKETGYLVVPRAEDLAEIFGSMHREIEKRARAAYLKTLPQN